MTVAAELLTFDTAYPRIRVGVADITRRTRIRMPGPVLTAHEAGLVRPGIGPFYSVGIHVTLNAGWVSSLCVVACSAVLDVAFCQLGMQAATAPHTNRYESALLMRLREKLGLVNITTCFVACGAERLFLMAGLAFRHLLGGLNAVRELEVQVMHLG
jgi:hypothetical protein